SSEGAAPSRSRRAAYAIPAERNALAAQAAGLFHPVTGSQLPAGAHHPPPGQAHPGGQHVSDGASGAWIPGPEGHLTVGRYLTTSERTDHRRHLDHKGSPPAARLPTLRSHRNVMVG